MNALPNIIIEKGIYKNIPDFDKHFMAVMQKHQEYIEKERNKIKDITKFDQTKKG